jgi:hypothetical protein
VDGDLRELDTGVVNETGRLGVGEGDKGEPGRRGDGGGRGIVALVGVGDGDGDGGFDLDMTVNKFN